ncbi:hypothetical protein BC834DRAFT_965441 [Gloeopeniophorella convolvens]|nr:hypothetical protein BC834DRAFT_965441 [Gloeopeniophorella convolvens]
MLSWFGRIGPKSSKTPPPREQRTEQQEQRAPPPPPPPPPPPGEKRARRESLPPPLVVPLPVAFPSTSPAIPLAVTPTQEQPRKRAFTAALNTPHDAVLAELQGHHPDHDPSARIDATPSTSALGLQSIDTLPAATSEAPGSAISAASPLPESLYDPFTGAMMGVLAPASTSAQTGEDLWARLVRIRALQAEVAGMHVTMEGIGLSDASAPRMRNTSPRTVGERLEDDADSDADRGSEAEEWRAREFEQSERRFDGRKQEIEQIMAKLDELSQALSAFHVLDTPVVDFAAASRSTTASSVFPPLSRSATLRHPDLHRVASEASVQGYSEVVDSPVSLRAPLPIVEEPEGGADPAPSDASVS